MKLTIIRHGQSVANEKERHQGRRDEWEDTPLSKKGIEQAKRVAKRIKGESFDDIYASDLKRAKKTAEIIGKELGKSVKFDKRLREKTDDEEMEDFIERVKSFFKDLILKDKHSLVVAHGGVNLALLAISTGNRAEGGKLVRRLRQSNTCVNMIEQEGGHYKIKMTNDVSHLRLDRKIIKIFERVQKIPYQVCKYDENEIDNKLKRGDCRHKSELLKQLLESGEYKVKKVKIIFDWKDLPIPKKILNILKKSSTVWFHNAVVVNIHGDWYILDPSWNPELEKKGFPVTRNWSGLEDTKQITEGEIELIKDKDYEKKKDEIKKKFGIMIDKEEAHKFAKALNKWLAK